MVREADQLTLAVVVSLAARLTLKGRYVAVLAVGVLSITHLVSSLARPLSVTFSLLDTLLVLTDVAGWAVCVQAALGEAAGVGGTAGAAGQVGEVRAVLVSAAVRVVTDVRLTGAAHGAIAAAVVPAAGLALPVVTPLVCRAVLVCDAARVGGGGGLCWVACRGASVTVHSVRPVTDRSYGGLVPERG